MQSWAQSRKEVQMHSTNNQVHKLRARIASLEDTLEDLKNQLADAEADSSQAASAQAESNGHSHSQNYPAHQVKCYNKTFGSVIDQLHLTQEDQRSHCWELTSEEYKRYGRQLILPEIGLRGGPSPPKYNLRLSLTQIDARTATTEKCVGLDRRRWRVRVSSCNIPRRCWGGKDWPHGW